MKIKLFFHQNQVAHILSFRGYGFGIVNLYSRIQNKISRIPGYISSVHCSTIAKLKFFHKEVLT